MVDAGWAQRRVGAETSNECALYSQYSKISECCTHARPRPPAPAHAYRVVAVSRVQGRGRAAGRERVLAVPVDAKTMPSPESTRCPAALPHLNGRTEHLN